MWLPRSVGVSNCWGAGCPDAKRRVVDMLKEVLGLSERLACKAVGLARATHRRTPLAQTPADPDAELRAWLWSYSSKHPCQGFRRAWAALRHDERREVNKKKAHNSPPRSQPMAAFRWPKSLAPEVCSTDEVFTYRDAALMAPKPPRSRGPNSSPQPRLSADERREQIIDSARQVFEQSGFNGARTRDLAAAAGVNEALLYRHFESKEELFEAAVATPLEEAVGKLVELSGSPPEAFDSTGTVMHERTYQFVYDLLGVMEEIGPLLGIVLFDQADRSAEYFRGRIEPSLQRIDDVVAANLSAWSHKDFDIELIVRLTVGMTWFLTVADKLRAHKRDRAATAETITTILLDGIGG